MIGRILIAASAALSLSACLGGGSRPEVGFAAPPPPGPVQTLDTAPVAAGESAANGFASPQANPGSIFLASQGYSALATGTRARRLGDMVTIVLVENTNTSQRSSGQTQREGSIGLAPPTDGIFDFLADGALNAGGQGSFNGSGAASQESQLTGTITVTISAIYPNGTAEVIGEKLMNLNQGDEWVQFSGRIRLVDIDGDNRLSSARVANARIIYSGRGAVQQSSRPGWLSRFFSSISPF